MANHVPVPIPPPAPPKPISSNTSHRDNNNKPLVPPKTPAVIAPTPSRPTTTRKLPGIASIPEYSKQVFGLPLVSQFDGNPVCERPIRPRINRIFVHGFRVFVDGKICF